jgi:outer membrane protein assembly factor BamB
MNRRFLGVAISLLLAASASLAGAAQAPSAWSQFRNGPAHTGFNASERSLSPANVRRLRAAWTFRTSERIWSSAAVVNGIVYIGSSDRRVYALRGSSGQQIWSAEVGGTPAAPAVVGGVVYVFDDGATVTALRADSGRRLRATTVSGVEGGFPAAPTVSGGVVYVMVEGVTALDRRTGRILWHRALECFGCPVTVAGPRAYIGASDVTRDPPRAARMYGLNAKTGTTEWSTSIAGHPVWTPAVSGNRVFLGSFTEVRGIKTFRLEAFDIADGHRHWRVPIGQSRFFTFTAPAVAGARIVVPSPSGYLHALDVTTGKRLWRARLTLSSSAPAIANGVVYVGSGDGNLYAFALKDGKQLWSAKVGDKELTSSPTVVNGAVYVGSDDGDIVAFRLRR